MLCTCVLRQTLVNHNIYSFIQFVYLTDHFAILKISQIGFITKKHFHLIFFCNLIFIHDNENEIFFSYQAEDFDLCQMQYLISWILSL